MMAARAAALTAAMAAMRRPLRTADLRSRVALLVINGRDDGYQAPVAVNFIGDCRHRVVGRVTELHDGDGPCRTGYRRRGEIERQQRRYRLSSRQQREERV